MREQFIPTDTSKLVQTAIFVALGVVFPSLFHTVQGAGQVLLPMHIPVLLCGLLVGLSYGVICGILTPLLAFLTNGMPVPPTLFSMMVELATYGAVGALLMAILPVRQTTAKVGASLVGAMLAGRLAFGLVNALIINLGKYSLQMWLTAAFVTAWPGIVLQLIVIPYVVSVSIQSGFFAPRQRPSATLLDQSDQSDQSEE